MLAVARAVGWAADWETLRSRPTIAGLMKRTGLSRRTVQRWLRWLEARSLLLVVRPGTTARFSPGILLCGEPNEAREWQLADPAVDGTGAPSGSLVFKGEDQTPTHAREPESTGQPSWPLNLKPHRRRDHLKAAESLRREHLVLRRISAPALASLIRSGPAAGFSPLDALYALEHLPGGHLHHHGQDVRFPKAWAAHRWALWAGHPPHSAELAARAERHRARQVPRRNPGTAPPPEWHDARAAMDARDRFPARFPQRKA